MGEECQCRSSRNKVAKRGVTPGKQIDLLTLRWRGTASGGSWPLELLSSFVESSPADEGAGEGYECVVEVGVVFPTDG